jgi:NAD(P)-dependent dehydrogenase (short-subunit alcohol dehydrogenase family)
MCQGDLVIRDMLERVRSEQQVALVVGTAHGLGAALARRFARAHMQVGLCGLDRAHLQEIITEEIEDRASVHAIAGDAAMPDDVERIFNELQDVFGPPDLVVFNATARPARQLGGILEVDPTVFERAWRSSCFGGFLVGRAAVRWMLARERGTIIFTDASGASSGAEPASSTPPRPSPAAGQSALRAVAHAMAEELGPKGIHVAHVTLAGRIAGASTEAAESEALISPGAVAETYLHLHLQQRTAWTHSLDVHPWIEPS